MVKRLVLILPILFFLLVSPATALTRETREPRERKFYTFADSAYLQPTTNFPPGQTVYFKAEVVSRGEKEHLLRLLDSNKAELEAFSISPQGTGPYLYLASFPAPADPGIYYLDLKIEGVGFSLAAQFNITVGETDSNAVVSIQTEANTSAGESTTEEPVKGAEDELVSEPVKKGSFSLVIDQLIEFYRQVIIYFSSWFKNNR